MASAKLLLSCRLNQYRLGSIARKKGRIVTDEAKDSNGNILKDGDSVTLIKDLKVKGTSITLKRGVSVKNIRLTGNPTEVECNTKQVKGLVLKTEFLKKA